VKLVQVSAARQYGCYRACSHEYQVLNTLPHVPSAVYDAQSRKGCMKDTRVGILADLVKWSRDPIAPSIYWLSGMAGTGKTSIAWSFCDKLKGNFLLGGSFFCSRTGSADRSDATRIVPTLARLLAIREGAFGAALKKQLDDDPDIAHKSINLQVEHLLQTPLATLPKSDSPTLVFVIDALDECSYKDATSDVLHALIASAPALPVKFFVTSRPERHIRETQISDPAMHRILRLHEIESTIVDADIRLYLENSLNPRNSTYSVLSSVTFSSVDVEKLAALAKGLFIFASTAIRYIQGGNPRERFRNLTSVMHKPGEPLTKSLDNMYELILKEALGSDVLEQTELESLKQTLSSLLALRMALSVRSLAYLLGQAPEQLRITFDRLHAVIHVPDDNDDDSLRTLHASFEDFLTLRADDSLRINFSDGDFSLSRGCFNIMRSGALCFNVSNSISSCHQNPDPIHSHIPAALGYACLQWPNHVKRTSNSSSFALEIERVFAPKFLFWLEALSALGYAYEGSQLIKNVLSCDSLVCAVTSAVVNGF
jgi:hypothetical protein